MPTIDIRRVQGDEAIDAILPHGGYAFDATPPLPDRNEWERFARHYKDPLELVLYEDGKPSRPRRVHA